MAVLQEGQWVLVEQPNGYDRLVLLRDGQMVDMGRYGKFESMKLVGLRSGLYYELGEGKFIPIAPSHIDSTSAYDDSEMLSNDQIFDDNSAQRLTSSEIAALKDQHSSGTAIIDQIVEGNENFGKKNAYSREKYVKRKKQKFLKWICPRVANLRLLTDHFIRKDPSRILYHHQNLYVYMIYKYIRDLRLDTLSQLLGHANVFQGGTYILWDESKGFVTAAFLSRLAQTDEDRPSRLVSIYTGAHLQTPFLTNFNLSDSQKKPLIGFSIADVGPEEMAPSKEHVNPNTTEKGHFPILTARRIFSEMWKDEGDLNVSIANIP